MEGAENFMRHRFHLGHASLIGLTLLALPALHADVTLRYKTEIKLNSALPAQMTQPALAAMGDSLPKESSLQLKNGKGSSISGWNTSICDFTNQEITLLDNEGKRYATLPFKQFGDEIANAMPQMNSQAAGMMQSMKARVETKLTGRTAVIQGVEGEEREVVMTLDAPPMPNMPASPMVRMVMHIWNAKASEVLRVPAVREAAGYNLFAAATMNPVSSLESAFRQMPGFMDNLAALYKEMQAGATPVILRMQMQMFMPMMGAVMKQMAARGNPSGAGFDPDAPLMEMNQELADLSTAAIPDAVFQIPRGYTSAPAGDIVKGMIAKAQAAAKR